MDNSIYAIYLPFVLLLDFLIIKAMKRAVFYNPVTRVWRTEKKWYHYASYIVLVVFFSALCLMPFFPEQMQQISRYYALNKGETFVEYAEEANRVHREYRDLPDMEFVIVYEMKSSVTPEEFINTVLPEITEYQKKAREWGVSRWSFGDYDFNREYVVRTVGYDCDNESELYRLYLGSDVAAEISIKKSTFFKTIYFHGYTTVYQKNAKNYKEGAI